MIKIFNKILVIITLCLFITGCNSVKEAFDPQRKNSSEEFLVEKKSPLSMPPEFDELPIPQKSIQKNQDQTTDIEKLINEKNLSQKELDEIDNLDKSLEDILLEKINKVDVNK